MGLINEQWVEFSKPLNSTKNKEYKVNFYCGYIACLKMIANLGEDKNKTDLQKQQFVNEMMIEAGNFMDGLLDDHE